jgi:YegS/Rv2252/BmrU family lipid kinase
MLVVHTGIVLNVKSSGTKRHMGELPDRLRKHGIAAAEIVTVDDHRQLEKRIRRFVKDGVTTVLVGGGDGSMAIAANALAYTDVTLGVLPLGTGNSFAQTLGIGTDVDSALAVIAGGHTRRVDLGSVNGRYFANFATVGLSAEIAENVPSAVKPVLGPVSYVVGGIVPFLKSRGGFKAKVRWKGGKLDLRTAQMVIASGRFFGKTPVAPDASATDGKLAFFTSEGTSHLEIARMYVAFALGLQTKLPDAHTFSAAKITVKTKHKEPISIDGDPGRTTPATFRVAHKALRVYVPAGFTGVDP